MATQVFATKTVELQDGTEVILKPAVIGRLRRFMEAWGKFSEAKDDNDGFTVFINCCGIALEENFKGKFDALKASKEDFEKGEFLDPEYKEYLEGVLELDTIYMVLDVCGNIKLNDPKLLEAAEALSQAQTQE